MSCTRQDQLLLTAAEALKQAAQHLENSVKSPTSPNPFVAETKGWQDWQITCLFYMVALQTFIMFYVFTWLHFPRMLDNQVATMAKTCERVSLYILGSPQVIAGAVQMTEKVASHPQNLGAMSKAMTAVFSSEVFMTSMRGVMKTLLLDRDIQRIVGVSFAGISKEAVKNTFNWNPNAEEDARRALLDDTGEANGDEGSDHSNRDPGPNKHEDPPHIWQQWLRGVQEALDPHRRQEAMDHEKSQRQEGGDEKVQTEESAEVAARNSGNDSGDASSSPLRKERSLTNPESSSVVEKPPQLPSNSEDPITTQPKSPKLAPSSASKSPESTPPRQSLAKLKGRARPPRHSAERGSSPRSNNDVVEGDKNSVTGSVRRSKSESRGTSRDPR